MSLKLRCNDLKWSSLTFLLLAFSPTGMLASNSEFSNSENSFDLFSAMSPVPKILPDLKYVFSK